MPEVIEAPAVSTDALPEYASLSQVAALFGISQRTVMRTVKAGRLRCIRMGNAKRGTPRFYRGDLRAFGQGQRGAAA